MQTKNNFALTCNEAGLGIIKHYEGFSSTVYRCPANVPTIGYGSIWDMSGKRVTMGHPPITQEEGTALLEKELDATEDIIVRLVKVPMNENQFSALCSLTYNIGSGNFQSSTLRMKLNRGDYEGCAEQFRVWRRGGGRILSGLVRRRAEEEALFLS